MTASLNKGKLKNWKDDKGFGFIEAADGGRDIFLHISELKDSTRRPKEGDIIYYYRVIEGEKVRAANAFILGARIKPEEKASSAKGSTMKLPIYAFPIVEVGLLSIVPLLGMVELVRRAENPVLLLIYPVMSLLTFALYQDDKKRAKLGERRIPERKLHQAELLGGWLGGFIAQRMLHHKSSKESYQAAFWAIVTLHQVGWIIWLLFGRSLL